MWRVRFESLIFYSLGAETWQGAKTGLAGLCCHLKMSVGITPGLQRDFFHESLKLFSSPP